MAALYKNGVEVIRFSKGATTFSRRSNGKTLSNLKTENHNYGWKVANLRKDLHAMDDRTLYQTLLTMNGVTVEFVSPTIKYAN